jgi:hypothetical protein
MNTLTISWNKIRPAWNASADKRFDAQLKLTKAPCIMHEDEYELTRFEYFEKEYNCYATIHPTNGDTRNEVRSQTYTLEFNTPEDLTFFALKWL